ncbi:hypothetical protein DIPPA_04147 [Diplonema papillatum]|nr:hypothetical protein DIPPA_04147 [Diplonema papillatum]
MRSQNDAIRKDLADADKRRAEEIDEAKSTLRLELDSKVERAMSSTSKSLLDAFGVLLEKQQQSTRTMLQQWREEDVEVKRGNDGTRREEGTTGTDAHNMRRKREATPPEGDVKPSAKNGKKVGKN